MLNIAFSYVLQHPPSRSCIKPPNCRVNAEVIPASSAPCREPFIPRRGAKKAKCHAMSVAQGNDAVPNAVFEGNVHRIPVNINDPVNMIDISFQLMFAPAKANAADIRERLCFDEFEQQFTNQCFVTDGKPSYRVVAEEGPFFVEMESINIKQTTPNALANRAFNFSMCLDTVLPQYSTETKTTSLATDNQRDGEPWPMINFGRHHRCDTNFNGKKQLTVKKADPENMKPEPENNGMLYISIFPTYMEKTSRSLVASGPYFFKKFNPFIIPIRFHVKDGQNGSVPAAVSFSDFESDSNKRRKLSAFLVDSIGIGPA